MESTLPLSPPKDNNVWFFQYVFYMLWNSYVIRYYNNSWWFAFQAHSNVQLILSVL
jgi:hypothetical protein